MTFKVILSACLAVGLITPAFAANTAPLRLAAATKWRADYDKDSCLLIRHYGEGKNRVIMSMEQFAPGDFFRLTLAGQPVRGSDENFPIRIQFGPAKTWQAVSYYKGSGKDGIPVIFVHTPLRMEERKDTATLSIWDRWQANAPLTFERANRITEFSIDPGRGPKNITVLELGPMGAPMAALDKCMDDLVATWGLNPEEQRKLLRRATPKTNPEHWIDGDDYPKTALYQGARAIVNFRIAVDENGKATSCHIQQAVGGPDFEKAVCSNLMRRATFDPALNNDGQTIPSFFVSSVRFSF